MAKVLLVEDDIELTETLLIFLEQNGIEAELATDGLIAWEYMTLHEFDVLVMDWGLPGKSGIDLLKDYRSLPDGNTPILMLTGRKLIEEKERCFVLGADDYLTKPFDFRELLARINSLIRRTRIPKSVLLRIRNIELDSGKRTLCVDGKPVHLQPRDLALLECLMKHAGETMTVQRLLNRVWGASDEPTPDGLRSAIRRIREKIDTGEESLIENIPRVGYRIVEE